VSAEGRRYGHTSVRQGKLAPWVIEVYDEARPWGSSPVATLSEMKRPKPSDLDAIVRQYLGPDARRRR
jgi:hypothetical protein